LICGFDLGLVCIWKFGNLVVKIKSFSFLGLCVEELKKMGACWNVYLYQVAGIEPLRVEVEALRGPTSWSFMLSVGHGLCVRLESRVLRIRSPDNIHAYDHDNLRGNCNEPCASIALDETPRCFQGCGWRCSTFGSLSLRR
jgi:hypothetical protein